MTGNLAASVRARLTNLARERKENIDLIFTGAGGKATSNCAVKTWLLTAIGRGESTFGLPSHARRRLATTLSAGCPKIIAEATCDIDS